MEMSKSNKNAKVVLKIEKFEENTKRVGLSL